MTTMTRTIRLVVGAAAMLALIAPAAQARPTVSGGGSPVVQRNHHAAVPVSPAGQVWLAHENEGLAAAMGAGGGEPATPEASPGKVDSGGFAWGAAAIGAGSVLAVGAIGAAALVTFRPRNVTLST
jgi:hypothetical protein